MHNVEPRSFAVVEALVRFAVTLCLLLTACHRGSAPARVASSRASAEAPSPSGVVGNGSPEQVERAASLRARLGPGFTVVVEPPFVVAGDGSPAAVQAEASDTLGWAVSKLKQDYFGRDPAVPIDVYLFRDSA